MMSLGGTLPTVEEVSETVSADAAIPNLTGTKGAGKTGDKPAKKGAAKATAQPQPVEKPSQDSAPCKEWKPPKWTGDHEPAGFPGSERDC